MNSMTLLAFLAVAVVAVSSMPQFAQPGVIPILEYNNDMDDFGQFSYSYLSGDGTYQSEQGKLVPNKEGDGYVLVKEGRSKYIAPDGKEINIRYEADENGYRAFGDSIPVAPVA